MSCNQNHVHGAHCKRHHEDEEGAPLSPSSSSEVDESKLETWVSRAPKCKCCGEGAITHSRTKLCDECYADYQREKDKLKKRAARAKAKAEAQALSRAKVKNKSLSKAHWRHRKREQKRAAKQRQERRVVNRAADVRSKTHTVRKTTKSPDGTVVTEEVVDDVTESKTMSVATTLSITKEVSESISSSWTGFVSHQKNRLEGALHRPESAVDVLAQWDPTFRMVTKILSQEGAEKWKQCLPVIVNGGAHILDRMIDIPFVEATRFLLADKGLYEPSHHENVLFNKKANVVDPPKGMLGKINNAILTLTLAMLIIRRLNGDNRLKGDRHIAITMKSKSVSMFIRHPLTPPRNSHTHIHTQVLKQVPTLKMAGGRVDMHGDKFAGVCPGTAYVPYDPLKTVPGERVEKILLQWTFLFVELRGMEARWCRELGVRDGVIPVAFPDMGAPAARLLWDVFCGDGTKAPARAFRRPTRLSPSTYHFLGDAVQRQRDSTHDKVRTGLKNVHKQSQMGREPLGSILGDLGRTDKTTMEETKADLEKHITDTLVSTMSAQHAPWADRLKDELAEARAVECAARAYRGPTNNELIAVMSKETTIGPYTWKALAPDASIHILAKNSRNYTKGTFVSDKDFEFETYTPTRAKYLGLGRARLLEMAIVESHDASMRLRERLSLRTLAEFTPEFARYGHAINEPGKVYRWENHQSVWCDQYRADSHTDVDDESTMLNVQGLVVRKPTHSGLKSPMNTWVDQPATDVLLVMGMREMSLSDADDKRTIARGIVSVTCGAANIVNMCEFRDYDQAPGLLADEEVDSYPYQTVLLNALVRQIHGQQSNVHACRTVFMSTESALVSDKKRECFATTHVGELQELLHSGHVRSAVGVGMRFKFAHQSWKRPVYIEFPCASVNLAIIAHELIPNGVRTAELYKIGQDRRQRYASTTSCESSIPYLRCILREVGRYNFITAVRDLAILGDPLVAPWTKDDEDELYAASAMLVQIAKPGEADEWLAEF